MLKRLLQKLKSSVIEPLGWMLRESSFLFLLFMYLFWKLTYAISFHKYSPAIIKKYYYPLVNAVYKKAISSTRKSEGTINRVNLIELSLRNMRFKLTRTLITVGGMAVGVAAIVFLVSIGYGLQEMVIARVARLDEMRQTDVATHPGSNVRLTDESIAQFKELEEVENALPLIASVAKINYKGSITDTPVYAVTKDYLSNSAIKTSRGDLFESNEIAFGFSERIIEEANKQSEGEVAGTSDTRDETSRPAEYKETIGKIDFDIEPTKYVHVRKEPNPAGDLLGYTKSVEGTTRGEELWGNPYESENESGYQGVDFQGQRYGRWIQAKVYLWEIKDEKFIPLLNSDGIQKQEVGYLADMNLIIDRTINKIGPKVLGDSDVAAEVADEIDWIDLVNESSEATASAITRVNLSDRSHKQAVVNEAFLKVLGIAEADAINQTFNASFIITGDLLDNIDKKLESEPADYTIVGLVPGDANPFFYVPFIDLKDLGVKNYSQIKVLAHKKDELPLVRQKIEALGYTTASVVDTVDQINQLFNTARIVLALIGTVALLVASLGMFNTLTVSLLERIREIGLMKAMGMKSYEVQELFLTESMIMGFFGGTMGLVLGFVAGKLLSILLSILAITKGIGFLDIASIPLPFTIFIIVLSLLVGLVTGIYPAKRATQISALNALRYE